MPTRFGSLLLVLGLLACAPVFAAEDESEPDSASASVTIKAADFVDRPVGGPIADGWSIWSSGAITCPLQFPTNGFYTFIVVARGEPARGDWPEMRVMLDGRTILEARVNTRDWGTYTLGQEADAGRHEVTIAFLNDFSDGGEDRNLHVASLTVVAPEGSTEVSVIAGPDYRQQLAVRERELAAEDERRTEEIRKGELRIDVVGSWGRAITNALVTVKPLRHEFLFGTALSSDAFREPQPGGEYARYLELAARYFNHAVTENALKWPDMEPERGKVNYDIVDRMAGWCESNRIPLRGHCLFYACEPYVPEWVKSVTDDELRKAIAVRARVVTGRYKGRIDEFDVNNEMLHCSYFMDRLGDNIRRLMFQEAYGANPRATLYVNDYGILDGDHLDRYVEQIRSFIEGGVPLSGIGIQAHFQGLPDTQKFRRALDALAVFGLPLKITEFSCAADDEAVQAECLEKVYRMAFAHPAVRGILMWGFWEKCHWRPQAAMLRADFSGKKAAETYERLVFGEWWTSASGQTDADGRFGCRSFYGDLEVSAVTPDGYEGRQIVRMTSAKKPATLKLRVRKKQSSDEDTKDVPAGASTNEHSTPVPM